MFQRFIQRPALAIVISLFIVFIGVLAITSLPKSQFPSIAPPMVIVKLSYPGASGKVLVNSSLIALEQAINGVQGMKYMFSTAASSGDANIQIIFNLGTDPNQALVNVTNRVLSVKSMLPEQVQLAGIVVQPIQPSMLMYINLYSKDTTNADMKFIFNYAFIKMLPEIQRINGVALAQIIGSRQYAMRVWLNPDRMRAYNINADEVTKALFEQSIIATPGRLGRADSKRSESIEYVMTYTDRYSTPEQYKEVIIRANSKGEAIRLKDVADVELGSTSYDIYSKKDEYPSAAIMLNQTYGSNATEVIDEVKAKLEELKKEFPAGMEYDIDYDVSSFLDASIDEVVHTLRDAFILVALVVFIFLGDWRSTLIPIIAVPVSLIGAFAVMQMFGLTINLITLFALVLAIGIVVDDAIVVVEAVHAKLEENHHISVYDAVKKVLREISGAIIAITLLMTSVFIPVAFMSGPVGIFYRQFSITMASSIVISGIVALTLTPVLCAMILKRVHGQPRRRTFVNRFISKFNIFFENLTGGYLKVLKLIVNRKVVTWGVLAVFCFGIFGITAKLPAGFVPSEDQGMIYAILQTPAGSTLERTFDVSCQLQNAAKKVDGVKSVSALAGFEVLTQGRGSNSGTLLINLKPWDERKHTAAEIILELEEKVKDIPGAKIEFFDPPAVPGYGAAGGITLQLLDKNTDIDYVRLGKVTDNFMNELEKRKELAALFTFYRTDYPQYELEIDNNIAMQKGVSISKAMDNLSILIGSSFDQGFIKFGRFFWVFVQAEPAFRKQPSDILDLLYVKNDQGEMVPYSAFLKMKKVQDVYEINRFNMYTTASIRCSPATGYSSGEAIKAIQEVAAQTLPKGYDIDWAALTKDEVIRASGNETIVIFLIVLIFVYLVLAAQYESFILPFAVILSLPAGIFGAFFFVNIMGLANDIYAQVALVMLVGLLGKNAVLIVEFAIQKNQEGMSVLDAAILGAKARFRPILMTSFAFMAGLIPLVLAHGPGAIANKTIGGCALGGMLFGTVFGIVIIPGLYYIFGKMAEGRKLIRKEDMTPFSEPEKH